MARAILHNSNYESADACRGAMDRYFAERNRAFLEHPRRAGKKIWGKERVEASLGRKIIAKTRVGGSQCESTVKMKEEPRVSSRGDGCSAAAMQHALPASDHNG
jgi:hypothetical protein